MSDFTVQVSIDLAPDLKALLLRGVAALEALRAPAAPASEPPVITPTPVPEPTPEPVPVTPTPIPEPTPTPIPPVVSGIPPVSDGMTLALDGSAELAGEPDGELQFTEQLQQEKKELRPGTQWDEGIQPNASVKKAVIDGEPTLVTAIWDVPKNGQTGARGFWGPQWNKAVKVYQKRSWLAWETRLLQFIPLQHGERRWGTIGPEGKMGALGIWAVNAETFLDPADGLTKLAHSLQNQSGQPGVYKADKRDPIPVGSWYESALEMSMVDTPTGLQRLYYENTVIEATNVATCGALGGMGLAWCLYVGEDGGVLPVNDTFVVQFRRMKVYSS